MFGRPPQINFWSPAEKTHPPKVVRIFEMSSCMARSVPKPRAMSSKHVPVHDDSWLFDDILAPAMGNFDDNEDGISVQSLNDICEPIYGMQGDNEEATLESLLAGSNRPSSPTRMDSSDSDSTVAVPDNSKQQKTLQALWDQGADSSNLMHSLGSLADDEVM